MSRVRIAVDGCTVFAFFIFVHFAFCSYEIVMAGASVVLYHCISSELVHFSRI